MVDIETGLTTATMPGKIGVVLPAIITAVFAGLVALGQLWANYQLDRIHRLTNTNFSEQKAVIAAQARRIDDLLAAVARLSQNSASRR